jgi:PAS domain S-box-containing protein
MRVPNDIPPEVFRFSISRGVVLSLEVAGEKVNDKGRDLALLQFREKNSHSEQTSSVVDEWEQFMSTAESMINSLVDGTFMVDVSGRLLLTNYALLELLGTRRYEVVGMPVGVLFAKDKLGIESSTARFGRIMKHGKVKDLNIELLGKNGEKIPVICNGSVIRSPENELLGILIVARDMRENKLMQELKHKNIELEKAYSELKNLDVMKDDLLSLVGHELRAPLSNILGYSEFLQEDNLSKEESEEFSGIIYQESQRLSRLVNDILDLSRMERGKLVYHYIHEDLNKLVERCVSSVESSLREKELKLDVSLDDGNQVIQFDPDRIQQVVTNILDNAIKFSKAGQTITVKTEAGQGEAKISIADQGLGIAVENAHKVFNKFEQIEDLRKHSVGSGLGMPIAKRIIEEGHEGKIWFESPGLGKGATFYITIPERERL